MAKIRTELSSQESFSARRSSTPPPPPPTTGLTAPSARLRTMGGSERVRKTPSPYHPRVSPGGAPPPPPPGVTVTSVSTPLHSPAAAVNLKPVTSVHWRTPGDDNDSSTDKSNNRGSSRSSTKPAAAGAAENSP